jgi:DNA polymerase III subunit epsilon
MDRQIVLDTETTGLEVSQDHRIIEIGCVELRNRRVSDNRFHHYLNPERAIDAGAQEVHGISLESLADKPRFVDIADNLIEYLRGAELLIHNADFDVGFLDAELARAGRKERIGKLCTVTDTIQIARRLHPGQKNSLDALCRRYGVDNTHRELHGALLDARLLADVYLAMTGGQTALSLERDVGAPGQGAGGPALPEANGPIPVIRAGQEEQAAHRARLEAIRKKAGKVLWAGELDC